MSISRVKPRQTTWLPRSGSFVRARYLPSFAISTRYWDAVRFEVGSAPSDFADARGQLGRLLLAFAKRNDRPFLGIAEFSGVGASSVCH
jgi:hypothetical protein